MLEVQKLHAQFPGEPQKFINALSFIGVDARDYPEQKMWLLDYNMIECEKTHPTVLECRGLVMGYDGSIIRKGFNRFFNLGENGVDTFDFENSVVFEKADGSLMFVYWCKGTGKWEIGTRGTAFAEGPNEWHGTFRNFMLNAMGRTEAQFQLDADRRLHKGTTYLFEAVGPDNRIVTAYETNHLIYLSSFFNGIEETIGVRRVMIDWFVNDSPWNVREIRQYSFKTQEDCLIALGELSGLQEGYVAFNKLTGGRVKIKSPVYLAAHRLRGNGLTLNSICELVVMNEVDEYLATFPEDASKFDAAKAMLDKMLNELCWNYDSNSNLETQKEFALAVKDLPLSGVMFQARKKDTDVVHEFNGVATNKKADWLKERLLQTDQYRAVLISEGRLGAQCL